MARGACWVLGDQRPCVKINTPKKAQATRTNTTNNKKYLSGRIAGLFAAVGRKNRVPGLDLIKLVLSSIFILSCDDCGGDGHFLLAAPGQPPPLSPPQRRATKPWHVCSCIGVHQTVKRGGSRRVPLSGRGRAHALM